jgi:hypothetical protein
MPAIVCSDEANGRVYRSAEMFVVRDMNGKVGVDTEFKLRPEQQKDRERLRDVVVEWTELAFSETPSVAVSACISVLSHVLVVAGGDPINEARIVAEALQLFVRSDLDKLRGLSVD